MQFLNPSILWFLFALMIPVIIHLFYFRRYKKIYFSDTRFLMEAQEVQKNASRIKHLLVLISRLLAMTFIILAFAQPFIPAKDNDSSEVTHVSFFIDNSWSMEAGGSRQNLLEEARSIAIESIEEYPDHYSFHVFDHNFAGEDQQWIDKENALNKVRRTTLTGKVKTLTQISGRINQMKSRLGSQDVPVDAYLLTDGQENIFSEIPDFEPGQQLQIVKLNPVRVSNLSVDSAWMEDPVVLPGQENNVFVKLSNYGNNPARDVRLSFTVNDQTRPAGTYSIPPDRSITDTIPVTFSSPGWKQLELQVDDEFIRFDDNLLLTLPVSDRIRVLLVNENDHEAFFRAAVESSQRTLFDTERPQSLIYSEFDRYDLIILDGLKSITSGLSTELQNYIRAGGNVVFFPHAEGQQDSYNSFLSSLEANTFRGLKQETASILRINRSSFIFRNVYRSDNRDLKTPTVQRYYEVNNTSVPGKERLLDFRNGKPYFISYARDNGNLFVCTSPSDEASSDILSSGSFFVPMLHRMSLSSRRGIDPYYEIGSNRPMSITESSNSNDPVYRLKGDIEVIPARYHKLRTTNLYAGDQIDLAGFYDLSTRDSVIARVAFNYNRSESDLSTLNADEITALSPEHIRVIEADNEVNVASAMVSKSMNTTFWKWCLILALGFLLLEQLLLRYFRPRN